jgi:hypothetical protein
MLLVVAGRCAAAVDGLNLTLSAARPVFLRGETVLIRLAVENMGTSSVLIFPLFSPQGSSQWPDTLLEFDVTGPSGDKRPFAGMKMLFDHPEVTWQSFRELPPWAFFGQYIPLNERQFAYRVRDPGVYRVRARAIFNGRHWLERERVRLRGRKELRITPIFARIHQVFDGILESNEIIFEIK